MVILTLREIRAEVDRLSAKIEAPRRLKPRYGYSGQDGHPHLEVDARGYHFVVAERGSEFERRTTLELDELLYWVFASITSSLAWDYELAHRVPGRDGRRIAFSYQVHLLSLLSQGWAERESREHEEILKKHPYDDDSFVRALLAKDYLDRGYVPEVASRIACERYPLLTPEE